MSLFVDGPAATIDDLTNEDCGLLEASQACGINASIKLILAHEDVAGDLELWLDRLNSTAGNAIWMHAYQFEQVVITPALKRWEIMHTLAMFYRDAWFSQFADRYQAKWNEYTSLARTAYEKFLTGGVGMVTDPVRQALPPVLGSVPGPQKGGTYYASVSWVNAAGQEGEASAPASIAIVDGNLMTITATGARSNATAFNVYAGADLNALAQQNDVPVPVGGGFTFVPGFRGSGRLPGSGQRPDFVRPLRRTLLRG
jgi:hypothetical protein